MSARLLYVMDPMCSWCWGFAPVAAALIAQAADAGVPTRLVVGGLRSASVITLEASLCTVVGRRTLERFCTATALPQHRNLLGFCREGNGRCVTARAIECHHDTVGAANGHRGLPAAADQGLFPIRAFQRNQGLARIAGAGIAGRDGDKRCHFFNSTPGA